MPQYRGVFIAPPTINQRAHRRSKTFPQTTAVYTSELSHLPKWESLSSLYTQGAPSIPGLWKEVTLQFQPQSCTKRQTASYELLCSSPKKLKQDPEFGIESDSRFSNAPQDASKEPLIEPPSQSTEESITNRNESIYDLSPAEYLDSYGQGERAALERIPSCKEEVNPRRDEGKGSQIVSDTQEKTDINPEDIIQISESSVKKVLTFGKTVYPNGFALSNNLDHSELENKEIKDTANTTGKDRSPQEKNPIPKTTEFKNISGLQSPNCIGEENNLDQLLPQHNSLETPHGTDLKLQGEVENLQPSTSNSGTDSNHEPREENLISDTLQEETQIIIEIPRKRLFVKTNDQIAHEIKRKGNPLNATKTAHSQNKRASHNVKAQEELFIVDESVEQVSAVPLQSTTIQQNVTTETQPPDQKPDEENNILEQPKLRQIPIDQANERAVVDDPNESQQIQVPTVYNGPIVFDFETPPTDNTLSKKPEDYDLQITAEINPDNVSPRFNLSPRLLDFPKNTFTFSEGLPQYTSTPHKKSQFIEDQDCVDIEYTSSQVVEEDLFEGDKMAGPNVKVNRELWESREAIGKLEEKLLKEQKSSEMKERAIKSLQKEVQKMQEQLSGDCNNNEDIDDLKSKLQSTETDNRILINQLKMVEEANKNIYQDLYQTKTQLRFQERRSDDATTQNAHTGRRLSQALQSCMDKSTVFTVFLHQIETNVITLESALRKLKAQRQALDDVLKEEEKPDVIAATTFSFLPKEKLHFLTEEAKSKIRSSFEKSLEMEFTSAKDKQLHFDDRMEYLESIINGCIETKLTSEREKAAANRKKIDLARVHVRALKDIEVKCGEAKKRTEDQIATMKGRISNEIKETSKEISGIYLAKQDKKTKPIRLRKTSNLDSPEAIRKKSVEEMANINRTIRCIKSKSQTTSEELPENEKEILMLNERMSRSLDDKIQLSEELLDTQSKIQELETRYEEKQQETQRLEAELSTKRNQIADMATEMQSALNNISIENVSGEIEDKPGPNEDSRKKDLKDAPHSVGEREEKEAEIDDVKEELVKTILLLKTEQQERQEAIRMNEDLFLELENREHEISNLVMELEQLKDKTKTGNNPETWKRLNDLLNSIEPSKTNEELVQLKKEIEDEVKDKEEEFGCLNSEFDKQKKEAEKVELLLEYYKNEMSKLQQEKLEQADVIARGESGVESSVSEKLPVMPNLEIQVTDREEVLKKLENEISELQKSLAKELECNKNNRENLLRLDDSLKKERQAKEYAFKRNKELEKELNIKDAKIKNFAASNIATKKEEIFPVKEAKSESPVTTLSDLRATMAQIQLEKEDLETEVDGLAIAMDQNHDARDLNGSTETQQVAAELSSGQKDFFDEFDGKSPTVKKEDEKSVIRDVQPIQVNEAVEQAPQKAPQGRGKVVEELEQTIQTLENEVAHLRSENALLEEEAVDVLDDGLKVENKILRNQVNSLTNELAIARADEDDMKREFEHVESRTKELQCALVNLTSLKNDLANSNEELIFQNKILHQELDLLKQKNELLEGERQGIAEEIADAVDSKVYLQENENLKTEIAKITLDLNVNREEAKRLEHELLLSEGKVKELELKLSSLQKEKDRLQILADDLTFQNKTHEKEVNLLHKKIAVLKEEIHVAEQDLSQRSDELKEKQSTLKRLVDENGSKEKEKQKLENELKVKEAALGSAKIAEQKQLKHLTERNSDLEAQLTKFKMESTKSRQQQIQLEQDLNELRTRLREADRKFNTTRDEKISTEENLSSLKSRVGQLQKDLTDAKTEIREKNEIIRKLNLKNSELEIALAERDEELRREERLRMDNMKSLDSLKIKMEKMEADEKKQRDRLFSLKSACSEANEAYEIVKKQNLTLRGDMQALKKKVEERNLENESNKREKEKLQEQILNASRTIDDIRKYSARDESLSPDSALGISVNSLTDLGSGPNSPYSDTSDNLFPSCEEELKFIPQEHQGLLCKMPTLVENFRAVVRDNETMKNKLTELMSNKEKMDNQLQHYLTLSDDLQRELGDKTKAISELQTKKGLLEDELNTTKNSLNKVERSFAETASEADLFKTTLKVREDTLAELRENMELLEEKEKALELYSKSMSEKYKQETTEKKDAEAQNKILQDKNQKQKLLLQNLEKKLSEYSARPRRISEPEIKPTVAVPKAEETPKKKTSEVAMVTLEEKLDSIVEYSDILESSLGEVEMGYLNLQAQNERLQRDMVKKEDFHSLQEDLREQETSFLEKEQMFQDKIVNLEAEKTHLEKQSVEKDETIASMANKEQELLEDYQRLKESFSPLEEASAILKGEIENLKEDAKQAEETRVKLETDLKLAKKRMTEMEITSDAYKEENERLRNDVIALSEEKCEGECKVSEAERREKKLNDVLDKARMGHEELRAEHETISSRCDSLQGDLVKAKETIKKLEAEQAKAQQVNNEMETKLNDITSEKGNLGDELQLVRKDLKDVEDRYKKSVDSEELLNQKLNKLALENSRLKTAFDQSQKRKTDIERELVESNSKNEDYEAQLENIRIEKAGLLKEITQKEENIENMEAKKGDLDEHNQKLTNDLFLSTKKVLSLQLNLESLRNDVNELGKETRRLVIGAVGREVRDEAEEKTLEADLEMSLFENEVVVQALKQTIKATERGLDLIRHEANISELENKLCQKDIDSVHREFAFLKDQLCSFRHCCQKLSDETKRLKQDHYLKDAILQDTREQYERVKEENDDNKESVVELQSKCNELEKLSTEYEGNVESAHNDIVRSKQTIAALEASLAKLEQKKIYLEKEKLVMQEKLNSLEALQRATKDEIRSDKKRIASLEVESNEKHGLARDLERVESNLSDMKLKYEDALKTIQEMKAELDTAREEMKQEEMELKNAKKDSENFKKHIIIEKEMRERVEQDLSDHVEELKACKKNLHASQRAHTKLQDDNETLHEKANLIEEAGQTLKKQLEVQSVEMKRLKEFLSETKSELLNTNEKYADSEKERKTLTEDLIHSEEQVKKLQDTCNELLKEKEFATNKVSSLNDALDTMISSHEEAVNSLKKELMITNKDLSVAKSSLERNQKRNEELLHENKNQEDKIRASDNKKQELFDKFWDSQNQLSEAQSSNDNLKTETKDLKAKLGFYVSKVEHLEDALAKDHEESENTIASLNERISSLKSQGNELSRKRDTLENTLQQAEEALNKTSGELNDTSKNLLDKEQQFVAEVGKRDNIIDELKTLSEDQRGELKKTKDTLRDVCRENGILKEKLEATEKTLEQVESKINEHENDHVDALAEAHAKLKVVSKMKASNSGENFVEVQATPLLESDPFEFLDTVDSPLKSTSIKDMVHAFHQTCISSIGETKDLQDKLASVNEDNFRLEESLNKERGNIADTKKHLQDIEKKKNKLEEEVKRLRRRLETFKQKSIEMERSKDDELCDLRSEKMIVEKENWALKEEVEELKAKGKETEDDRDRYVEDLNATQRQVLEARDDIKLAQEHLDDMQEQLLETKKRIFELEAKEKSLQQQLKEKEKELCVSQTKADELAKLYDNANQKKTELFSKVSKAEDKIRDQENQQQDNEMKTKEMEEETESLKTQVSELQQQFQDLSTKEQEGKDKIEELEIQRGSLQACNEILKHQLELAASEKEALKNSYDNSHDESLSLSRALNEITINKDNLETDLKCISQEKERLQEALQSSEQQLRESEDNLVKAFQEGEALKRQMLKVQSTACAESVKLQGEFAKMKSELESTKNDSMDKDKENQDKVMKLKVAEKEIENLKRELNDVHSRESELKLDYTSANSKLQSYVLERECWEREVKTVLGEIEQQKNANASKEHRLERLRMRYEQEIGFLSQRVASLERELKIVQDASEQQRHADEIAHKLNVEAKDIEIDNLRMRLQAMRMQSSDKNTVVDQMKNQIDERTSQIGDLMNQMSLLKDSYKLELASVQADLKCSQMENLLKIKKDMDHDNQLGANPSESVSDLLEAIKSSRKESERLRHLLGSRMKEMNNLKKDLISKRAHTTSPGSRSYGLYNE